MRYRPDYAPAAQFAFEIRPAEGAADDAPPPHATVFLRERAERDGAHRRITLSVDGRGRFPVPVDLAQSGDWELRSDLRGASLRLQPLILSPGSDIADRRFGDLRLQCRVSLAFIRLAAPLRLLATTIGPCDNRRVQLEAKPRKPLASARIIAPSRDLMNAKRPGRYVLPLADKTIPNEARLVLTYQ